MSKNLKYLVMCLVAAAVFCGGIVAIPVMVAPDTPNKLAGVLLLGGIMALALLGISAHVLGFTRPPILEKLQDGALANKPGGSVQSPVD